MLFASYNIQYGRGRDERFDLARICDVVRGADVIAMQEVERFWRRSGMVDQPAEIARLLPEHHWVYGPGLDMAITDGPDRTRRRQFGNMLLAKTPIISSRNHMLPKDGTRKQFSLQRCALEAVIDTPFGPLRAYSIHLTHVDDGSRAPQIDAIMDIHARAPAEGGAWCGTNTEEWTDGLAPPPMPRHAVLMGDFNFPPDSPLYPKIVGGWSPRYGRCSNIEGFVDAWAVTGHGESEGITCPSESKRIDYCYVSTALASHVQRAWIDGDAAGSDHQPIWTEIA